MNRNNYITKLYPYLITAVLTALIWTVICAAKNIYPFGNYSMCEGDYKAQVLAVFTHVWDFLHGRSALLFDWCQGLGNNLTGTIWHFGILSPSSLFFFFISRDQIEKSTFIFILIKLIAISVSFGYVLRKFFPKLPELISVSLVLLYIFCPFNMEYYLMPNWLDMVCLFPLIIYFGHSLFEEGNVLGFIITLSLVIMMNFQLSYMLAIHLILCASSILILYKDKYQSRSWLFVRSCFISCLLTSWIIIPGMLQTLSAQRTDSNKGYIEILNSIWIINPDKWFKIINIITPLILFVICFVLKFRKDKKYIFLALMISFMAAPIVLESTNLLYHGGSYESFTMRFAYMITFWVLIAGAHAYCDVIRDKLKTNVTRIIGILFLLSAILTSALIAKRCVLVAYDLDKSALKIASDIYDTGNYSRDIYDRVKVESLSSNLNQMAGFGSIQNYTVSEDSDQIDAFTLLGYARIGYRMDDQGGTSFSDALFGFRHTLSGDFDNYSITETELTYKPGILLKGLKEADNDPDRPSADSVFEAQNALFKTIIGSSFLKEVPSDDITVSEPARLLCYVPYMAAYNHVYVEDEMGNRISDLLIDDTEWKNGIFSLGDHSDEVLSVYTENGEPVSCAVMSLDALYENIPVYADRFEYIMNNRGMEINLDNSRYSEGYDHVFIPVYLSKGFTCKVNGNKVAPVKIAGGMAIPVSEGENSITLKFTPPGLIIGIILSILGLSFLLGSTVIQKTRPAVEDNKKACHKLSFIAVMLSSSIICLLFYILPVLFLIINIVKVIL